MQLNLVKKNNNKNKNKTNKPTINSQGSIATFSNPLDAIISLASEHKVARIFQWFYPGSWYIDILNHSITFIQQISVYWWVSFSNACEVYYNSCTHFACCICGQADIFRFICNEIKQTDQLWSFTRKSQKAFIPVSRYACIQMASTHITIHADNLYRWIE